MSYDSPPSSWARSAKYAGNDVYYSIDEDVPSLASLVIWHWCTANDRWKAAGCRNHTLVQVEPLHLEPSLLWECCNKHGWIRNGAWTEA